MNIIGEVEGKTCILVDDMIDTAGTLGQAAQALKDDGATRWLPTLLTRCCREAPWTGFQSRHWTS